MRRRLAAEALGTGLLLAIVVGSGIMGDRLSGGSDGLALLANSLATGAGLVVLILVLGPVSGAHFNPVVTLVFALRRAVDPPSAALYVAAQTIGAVAGVLLAHGMFGEQIFQLSAKARDGAALGLAEAVATFGLIVTILGCLKSKPDATPFAVGLYITSAYWFTASTSFANPAVTIARALTDTFAGIAWLSVPLFIGAQVVGALAGMAVITWLSTEERSA